MKDTHSDKPLPDHSSQRKCLRWQTGSTSQQSHGCTGKGNDQLRFEAIFRASKYKIHAPMRELNLARSEEIEYALEHGIDVPTTFEKPYSVDENLWSRSIEGGRLEDPSYSPPDDIFEWTTAPTKAKAQHQLSLEFEKGVPISLNGCLLSGLQLIKELNEVGGKHGVGRTDIMEDRILGLKAREIYCLLYTSDAADEEDSVDL